MAEITNEFAWSWSRHQMLYQCARKIYWQYYGSWGGWDAAAPKDAALAYRLKQLKSVAMLVGDLFHEVLGERLRMRSDAPAPVPVAQIREEVERRLLKRLRESRHRDWERFAQPKKYAMLFEDYYGPGVNEGMSDAALQQIAACAQGLAASPYGRRSFEVPKRRLRIIDPVSFDDKKMTVDGVAVYAAPDLVAEDKHGTLHIIDWKTGRPGKANIAQLAVYGLYVSEKLGAPIDRITAHLVYLRGGAVELHGNLREGVAEARRMISTYTMDVRARLADVASNTAGDIGQFPMTEDRSLCRRCNFREICGRLEQPPAAPADEED
ncbi:MAG TPA: PD-(D/E)XK nuclease family protein [Candidatus Eremiobacteraceae bacterium]